MEQVRSHLSGVHYFMKMFGMGKFVTLQSCRMMLDQKGLLVTLRPHFTRKLMQEQM